MKRNFKLKAFVLAMVVMMGLSLVPSISAATVADMKYKNVAGVTADNAKACFSITTDKKELTPNGELTVGVRMDKVPENGICALSLRIGYDNTKLEPIMCNSKGEIGTGKAYKYVNMYNTGKIAQDLQMDYSSTSVMTTNSDFVIPSNISAVVVGAYSKGAEFAATETGLIFEIKFKVKENASGNVDLFLFDTSSAYGGFDIQGVYYNEDEEAKPKRPESWFVDTTGLDGMKIPVPATGITFEGLTSVDLDKSGKRSMDISSYAKPNPSNTTDEITWESDNTAVATVANGVVTAVANGTANVTVRCGAYSATVPVNVTTSPSTITFAQQKYTVDFDQTISIKNDVTVGPEDAQYDAATMTWSSDNEAVVTVDNNGNITGKSKGTANVTVRLGSLSKSVPVTVAVPLRSITLDTTDVVVYKGDEAKVKVTANPNGAVWTSLEGSFNSGAEYAQVKEVEDGIVITGVARGNAVVAVSADGNTTEDLYKLVNVTVKENKVTGATIDNEAGAEVLRGETLEMVGSYTTEEPETVHKSTDDTTKVWESLNPEIATVDKNGVVTGVKEGTATIKLTVAGHTATYEVEVKEIHVDGIVFSEETQKTLEEINELTVGDVVKIEFTVTPEGKITDTVEEILEFINVDFDKDLVDVTVEYDKETGKGVITVTVKAAGDVDVEIAAGDPEDEETETYVFSFTAVEPVVEEAPETGDMSVAMMLAVMAISLMGVVASKKVFVK